VASGGYSTIGVASPLLLFLPWFWAKARVYRPRLAVMTWPAHGKRIWVLAGIAAAATAVAFVLAKDSPNPFLLAAFYGLVVAPLAVTVLAWVAWFALFAVACFVWSSIVVVPWSFHEDPEGAAAAAHKELGLDTGDAALPEIGAGTPAGGGAPASRESSRSAAYAKKAKGAPPSP
jgi:hypothetical protein